jgi:hypothetical protein
VSLSGDQARGGSDAEVLSQSLHQFGFSVEPPRTETVAGGVSFTLTGKPAEAKAASAPANKS